MKKKSGILMVLSLMVLFSACQKKNSDLSRLDQLDLENEKLRKENTELKQRLEISIREASELKEAKKQIQNLTLTIEKLNAGLNFKIRELQSMRFQVRNRLRKFLENKKSGIWGCDNNASFIEFKKEIKSASVIQIIKALDMNLILKSIKGNTVFIKQEESEWTNNWGSSGAKCILAEVVFSLTSVIGIEYVDFEFEEGEHASPGRYSRLDFFDLWPLFPPAEDSK